MGTVEVNTHIYIKCDAGNEIGLGHLSRCISIYYAMKSQGFICTLLVSYSDLAVGKYLNKWELEYVRFHFLDYTAEQEWLNARKMGSFNILMLDISHSISFKNTNTVDRYLTDIGTMFDKIVFWDGLHSEMLSPKLNTEMDMVVLPYVGAVQQNSVNARLILAGPEYYIKPLPYNGYQVITINENVQSILVSMGGGDPFQFTPRILRFFSRIDFKGSLKVVLGVAFNEETRIEVKKIASIDSRITLVDSPSNMAQLLAESDVCIIASGLTKYEAAILGVPAIHVSFNQGMRAANESFATACGIDDLGELREESQFDSSVSGLINSVEKRQSISQKSKCLVDGRGGSRIARYLMASEGLAYV